MLAYLAVEIEKCDHQEGHKFIRTFASAIGITQVFEDLHGGAEVSKTANFCASIWGGGGFQVDDTLTVGDLLTVKKSSVNKTLKIYLLAPNLRKTLLILRSMQSTGWERSKTS